MTRTFNLVRTGTMVPFLEVSIGSPFWAHDKVWVRTAYDAATTLGPTPVRSEGRIELQSTCNFLIDECDREVEALEYKDVIA